MLIQPDSFIRLIKKCPLDKTYEHTIYFDSEEQQVNYFKNTLEGIPFNKQSYQRYASGVLHVQAKTEDLYECNYLMFQNGSFGDKYFYAFITSIEYVNNVSSRVTYEIDVMQTWFFNYEVKDSFIEREHSVTDKAGENLVPEKVDTGEFVLTQIADNYLPFKGGEYDIIIAHGTVQSDIKNEETNTYDNHTIISNVFCGIDFIRYQDPAEAYVKLKKLNDDNKSSEVVAVFQVPRCMWGGGALRDFTPGKITQRVCQNLSHNYDTPFKNNPLDDDEIGYVPKNKKLYTAPFFGIICSSSSGENKKYAYEYFKDPKNPLLGLSFCVSASPEASLVPLDYKGIANNIEEELICKDFPQCAYATDSFREYLAQNAGRLFSGASNTILSTLSPVSNTVGNAKNVINTIGQWRDISVLADKPRGNSASYINYTRNTAGFIAYQYKIRKEFAVIIDNYFNMFGYATHVVKKPNRNSRPHWNYVKTGGCVILGSAPADDIARIRGIYDSGITFWKHGDEVGNYNLDNSPI